MPTLVIITVAVTHLEVHASKLIPQPRYMAFSRTAPKEGSVISSREGGRS
jgi:hypothetical protein